jgi:hypothetical protein
MDVGVRDPGGFDEAAQCLHGDLFTHAVGEDHCNLFASLNHAALPNGQACLCSCDPEHTSIGARMRQFLNATTGLAASFRIARGLSGFARGGS